MTEEEYIQTSFDEAERMFSGELPREINADFKDSVFEEFDFMDEDKDGCVNREEYVDFVAVFGDDEQKNAVINEYEKISKKNEACLLRDEYFAYVDAKVSRQDERATSLEF